MRLKKIIALEVYKTRITHNIVGDELSDWRIAEKLIQDDKGVITPAKILNVLSEK